MNKINLTELYNTYYEFGYTIYGPFLYGFISWLIQSIREKKYKKIFFLARDGYMMVKAFDILQPNIAPYEYIYCSRNSLRSGLLWKSKTYTESLKYLGYEKYIPFSELVAYYGLEKDEINSFLDDNNINIDEDLDYSKLKSNGQVQKFYNYYRDLINKKSKEQFELVNKYLDQIGMKDYCAIVDIGWHGSMQLYLEEYLKETGTTIDGYYVGVSPINALSGDAIGWLYNSDKEKMRKKLLCFFGVIEKLFQSHEGSARHYIEENGVINIQKEKYEYADDAPTVEKISVLQTGALDYVKKNKKGSISIKDSQKYANSLINFGVNPTLNQTKLFDFLYNVDGSKAYYLPQKSLFNYRPKEFAHALSNSCWKTGFMKAAFKIPGPYFYIYQLIKK